MDDRRPIRPARPVHAACRYACEHASDARGSDVTSGRRSEARSSAELSSGEHGEPQRSYPLEPRRADGASVGTALSIAPSERAGRPLKARRHCATRFERIEGDGYLTIDAPWVVPALLRSAPIEGRVLEPAAGPFPDDGSPTRKRASSQRRDALWADPQHQALTQEDDANDDPIPPAR